MANIFSEALKDAQALKKEYAIKSAQEHKNPGWYSEYHEEDPTDLISDEIMKEIAKNTEEFKKHIIMNAMMEAGVLDIKTELEKDIMDVEIFAKMKKTADHVKVNVKVEPREPNRFKDIMEEQNDKPTDSTK